MKGKFYYISKLIDWLIDWLIWLQVNFKLSDAGLQSPGGYNFTEIFDGVFLDIFKPSQNFTCLVNPTGIYFIKAQIL